jgi:hypothetical protein
VGLPGYNIRLESVTPSEASNITLCTNGVLLRQLMGSRERRGEALGSAAGALAMTHLILDEVRQNGASSPLYIVAWPGAVLWH